MSKKIYLTEFMLTEKFLEFNNIENKSVPENKFDSWDDVRLIDTINKIVRERLRRDVHGDSESPFAETNEELTQTLYVLTLILQDRSHKTQASSR